MPNLSWRFLVAFWLHFLIKIPASLSDILWQFGIQTHFFVCVQFVPTNLEAFFLLFCFSGLSMKPQFSGMNSSRAVFWSCSTASTMLKWMWKYCASLSSLSQLGQMCCLLRVKLMPRLTYDYVSWLFFTTLQSFFSFSKLQMLASWVGWGEIHWTCKLCALLEDSGRAR